MNLRPTGPWALACLLLLLPAAPLRAQSVLLPDDVGVVTTDGVFLVRDQVTTTLFTPPPGRTLAKPAIEWVPGSDAFLVVSAAKLYRCTVTAVAPVAITWEVISPDYGPTSTVDLQDLDIDPSTGELWILDGQNDRALRFAPPFGNGMAVDFELALVGNPLAMAVDSVNYPKGVVYPTPTELRRTDIEGTTVTLSDFDFNHNGGVDVPAQTVEYPVFCHRNQDAVIHASGSQIGGPTSPGSPPGPAGPITYQPFYDVGFDMNFFSFEKIVFGPLDIEWDPASLSGWVLCEEANANLFPGLQPGLGFQVVSLKFPQSVLSPPALLHSDPTGASGLTGTDGDLALVNTPFPYVSPFGPTSVAFNGEVPRLNSHAGVIPAVGNLSFRLHVFDGPPDRPLFFRISTAPISPAVPSCSELLSSPDWTFLAYTEPDYGQILPLPGGYTEVNIPLFDVPGLAGSDIYALAVICDEAGTPVPTNGVKIHIE